MSKFDEETANLPLEKRFALADHEFDKLEALMGGANNVALETYQNIMKSCGLQGDDYSAYYVHCLEMESTVKNETREIYFQIFKEALKHPLVAVKALVSHMKK